MATFFIIIAGLLGMIITSAVAGYLVVTVSYWSEMRRLRHHPDPREPSFASRHPIGH